MIVHPLNMYDVVFTDNDTQAVADALTFLDSLMETMLESGCDLIENDEGEYPRTVSIEDVALAKKYLSLLDKNVWQMF